MRYCLAQHSYHHRFSMSASFLPDSIPLPVATADVDELSSLQSVLHPHTRLLAALERDRRFDGRTLSSSRPMNLSVCSLLHCDSAAVASVGASSLLCTCSLQVAAPLTQSAECGFLSVDCHLTPLCSVDSADFTFTRPSSLSSALSSQLHSLLTRSVRLSELAILAHTAAWMLHVDLVVTSYDGAILDAALLAAHTALAALTVPECEVTEAGEVVLSADGSGSGSAAVGRPLTLDGRTVCSTFAAVDRFLLLDPTADELQLSEAVVTVAVGSDGRLVDVWKAGGAVLGRDELEQCIALSEQRSAQQLQIIDKALQAHSQQPQQTSMSEGYL